MQAPIVLKVSGSQLDETHFVETLAQKLTELDVPVIIVHGGGKEISLMQEQLGIQPEYLEGLRISDDHSLKIVEQVLCGAVNPRVVRTLLRYGLDAQGLSGMDRGLIRARKLHHPKGDLGRVGEPVTVRSEVLLSLLQQGVIPVIAPICIGEDGEPFNVNADHVAGAVAKAVNAQKVIFVTKTGGVLVDHEVIEHVTPMLADVLIENEIIYAGMLPKVRTAIGLIESGVQKVVITDMDGLLSGQGTTVSPDEVEQRIA